MRPTQCVGGLYLTVVDSLAPLPINNNNNKASVFKFCLHQNLNFSFFAFGCVLRRIFTEFSRGDEGRKKKKI